MEEIYDDGTSVSKAISGVRNVAAMFETAKAGPSSGRGNLPRPPSKAGPQTSLKPGSTPPGAKPVSQTPLKSDPLPKTSSPEMTPGQEAKDTESPLEQRSRRRSSRLNIPDVFQQSANPDTTKPSAKPAATMPGGDKSPSGPKPAAIFPKPKVEMPTSPTKGAGFSPPVKPLVGAKPAPSLPSLPKPTADQASSAASPTSPRVDDGKVIDFRSTLKPSGLRSQTLGVARPVVSFSGGREQKVEGEEEKVSLRQVSGERKKEGTRRSVITRASDNKRFRLNDPPDPHMSPPPKPAAIPLVDLSSLLQEYQAQLAGLAKDDEVYDDVGVSPSNCRPVSMLPEMTEEEELESTSTGSDRLPSLTQESEEYSDVTQLDGEETYEPLDDFSSPVDNSLDKSDKNLTKLKKQEEKERKAREKKEREEKKRKEMEEKKKKENEERELKRKEKEEKDMRDKFKIVGNIERQGEGTIKADVKGRGLDLAVQAGQKVGIVRMNGNPRGKWLVQTAEGKLGYVDSNNVEMMTMLSTASGGSGDSGEVYDDVGGEDIYEEFQ